MEAPSPYDGDLSLPDIETVTIDAVRGSDGLIGVQILSHPNLAIHNIVVVIEEGSEAERHGLLKLGDVVVEVDGLRVDGIDMIGAGALAVAKQKHQFTVRRFISERARRASLEATSPLEPEAIQTLRPSKQLPFQLGLKNAAPSTSMPAADPFHLTASTPRDQIFAQAAALQRKYSAQATTAAPLVTPRTKASTSGALSRAKTAKARRVSGGAHIAQPVLAH